MDVSEVIGAIYDPLEGHLDPYGATHAFAKAARLAGAEIYRQTRVKELVRLQSGVWHVVTDAGTIAAEHVVNAGGLWAHQVGQMVGVDLPVVAMEHHYLLTEDLPELRSATRELPLVLDLDGEIYLRQERKGVLLGVYEKQATPWAVDGAPWEYGETELLAPNLERISESLEKGFRRFPSLAQSGIRKVINGPFTFSPDGNPLVGPVPGIPNYWVACGVMAGFAQGGGVGLALAQWLTQGEPEGDIYAMDVARFGPYASRTYTVARAKEFYARRFQIAYPNEFWPAGRPNKISTLHNDIEAANAVFGVSYGLEIPLFFAVSGTPVVETPSLRRSNAFAAVREECLAARQRVGLLDISSFAKYLVNGRNAAVALDRLLAGRLPTLGRIRLTPMLASSGCLMGDLTTMCLGPETFLVGGSGYLQAWHMRWFARHLVQDGLTVENVSDTLGGIALVGPQSRAVLAHVTNADVSDRALPFMAVRRMNIAFASAIVARLSVTGELGYEIYVPALQLPSILAAIKEVVAAVGGRWIGMHALNCLRLEKSFGIWSREFSRDYTPRMAGLDRFVDYDKVDFVGRAAALKDRTLEPARRLVTLAIHSDEADASGYEPIYRNRELVGFVTSGGYGHCVNTSLAMGYVLPSVTEGADDLSVTILGEPRPARLLTAPMVDPTGGRMRG
jgi:dimethylglycine dehydrogenase